MDGPVSGAARGPLLGVCLAADGPLSAVLAELGRWLPVVACDDGGRPYAGAFEGRQPDLFLAAARISAAPWICLAGSGGPVAAEAVGDLAVGDLAVGDLAVGDLAVGDLAVGDLAVGDLAMGHEAVGDGALAVLSADRAVLVAAGPRGVALPTHPEARLADTDVRWTPPFVRRRMRAALGPAGDGALIADRRGARWLDHEAGVLPPQRLDTALARCAAVWTVDAVLAGRALAWGAPLLAPAAVVAELGLTENVEVRLSDTDRMRAELAALARDGDAAARLSWAGRRRYERRCDAARAAAQLADAIDRVLPLPHDGLTRARLELALLGTPADGRPPARLLRASAALQSDQAPVIGPDDGGPPVSLTPAATGPADAAEPPAAAPEGGPGRLSRLTAGRTDRLRASGRDLARRGVRRVEDRVYMRVQGQLLADAGRLKELEQALRRTEAELLALRTALPRRLDALERRVEALERREA